jgi:hypothetical protein
VQQEISNVYQVIVKLVYQGADCLRFPFNHFFGSGNDVRP